MAFCGAFSPAFRPLFDAGVPSVLEGRFADDGTFVSERIVIKHSEEYREDNPDHVSSSPS